MIQCKLCGTPLGKEPTTEELETHWKKHHNWHWESNKEKTPEEALLKKRSSISKQQAIMACKVTIITIQNNSKALF